jgi:protein-disulfide isomerase
MDAPPDADVGAPVPSPPSRGWLPSRTFLLILLLVSVATNALFALRLSDGQLLRKIAFLHRPAAPVPGPGDRVRGDLKTGVPVIVYADFQCPFSARLHEMVRSLEGEVGVAIVFRHFPLKSHPLAARAAEAAECAGDQGFFWEYADNLFAMQKGVSEATLREIAAGLGLDQTVFGACLDAGIHRQAIRAQAAEGARLRVNGTPTFFIRGRRFDSALPYPELKRAILEAGGVAAEERCE